MKDDILESLKSEFNYLNKTKDRVTPIVNEIEELKKDENVKRYIELSKLISKHETELVSKDENQILEETIKYMINDYNLFEWNKKTNEIYFCIGRNLNGIYGRDYDVCFPLSHEEEDNTIKVGYYIDIENPNIKIVIPEDECDKFEKTHRIIKTKYDLSNTRKIDEEYNNLLMIFYQISVKESQEEAIKKILKK